MLKVFISKNRDHWRENNHKSQRQKTFWCLFKHLVTVNWKIYTATLSNLYNLLLNVTRTTYCTQLHRPFLKTSQTGLEKVKLCVNFKNIKYFQINHLFTVREVSILNNRIALLKIARNEINASQAAKISDFSLSAVMLKDICNHCNS